MWSKSVSLLELCHDFGTIQPRNRAVTFYVSTMSKTFMLFAVGGTLILSYALPLLSFLTWVPCVPAQKPWQTGSVCNPTCNKPIKFLIPWRKHSSCAVLHNICFHDGNVLFCLSKGSSEAKNMQSNCEEQIGTRMRCTTKWKNKGTQVLGEGKILA